MEVCVIDVPVLQQKLQAERDHKGLMKLLKKSREPPVAMPSRPRRVCKAKAKGKATAKAKAKAASAPHDPPEEKVGRGVI
jgi:hypothetical protein